MPCPRARLLTTAGLFIRSMLKCCVVETVAKLGHGRNAPESIPTRVTATRYSLTVGENALRMWSDRKQEDSARPEILAGKSETGAARSLRTVSESSSIATIGKGMVIKGHVRSGEHIHLVGEVEGSIHLPGFDLTVAPPGRVRGDVSAREIDASGLIEGNVDATKKITVRKGGRLLGDLRTPGIVIEDGAYFKGKIEIVNSEMLEELDSSGFKKAVGATPIS